MSGPRDPALPTFGLLLDPEAATALLERSLGRAAQLDNVRISRVSYKPGERASVHYEVCVDGRDEDAVARVVAGRDLESRLRRPRLLELARRVDGRSPAAFPIVYEPAAGALITWLPFDSRLPALAEPSLASAALLSYKPRRRAVLRLDGEVLKVYASARQFEAAAAALQAGSALHGIRTPACKGVMRRLRLTAQEAVDGAPVAGLEAAAEAAALLRRLRGTAITRLEPAPRVLEAAARKASLIATVAPTLAARVESLVRRLTRAEPTARRLVPAHGDFHSGQLLRVGDELFVLDLDLLCLGPPALDPAEYTAACAGVESADAVLDALLEGYGARPEALEWHVAAATLIRASHPFHRQLPDWPERVERMVGVAEEFAAR
jgi:Phosphotransferase enzyme family